MVIDHVRPDLLIVNWRFCMQYQNAMPDHQQATLESQGRSDPFSPGRCHGPGGPPEELLSPPSLYSLLPTWAHPSHETLCGKWMVSLPDSARSEQTPRAHILNSERQREEMEFIFSPKVNLECEDNSELYLPAQGMERTKEKKKKKSENKEKTRKI